MNYPVPDFSQFERLIAKANHARPDDHDLTFHTCSVLLQLAGVGQVHFERAPNRLLLALSSRGEIMHGSIVAACLLRLLPLPAMSWLSGAEWRRHVLLFLEGECGRIVYSEKEFSRLRNTAAHTRIAEFGRRAAETEREFISLASSLLSLDSLNRFKADFMRHLSSQFSQVAIQPFLPTILRTQLTELFRRLEAYRAANENSNRDIPRILEEYQSATDLATSMLTDLNLWSSRYSAIVRAGVVAKVLAFIEADLNKNKAVQKTTLKVEFQSKKFPLHRIGALVRLGFRIINTGPGFAYDIYLALASDDSISWAEEEFALPGLSPNEAYNYEIEGKIQSVTGQFELVAQVTWSDFRGQRSSADNSFTALPQRNDIDWEALAQSDPYSPEPVTNERDLVGRRDVLNRLLGMTRAKGVGSTIIHGQKRVGKTSIARVLQTLLLATPEYLVVYLESGDYADPTATGTVRKLGRRVVSEIKDRDPNAQGLPDPILEDALSPLTEFLDKALEVIPKRRILIFLDEFDEIAIDLYARGPLGDAFFLTLRSISSRPRIGIVLIGGEKMSYILSVQGNRVNKWDVIPVDYFSREESWSDYRELVQRPTYDALEFSEPALVALHAVTAGNPYFTKLICRKILSAAVQQHDSHITESEVQRALNSVVVEAAENIFSHFWDDALLVAGDIATKKVAARKKILVALADVLHSQKRASRDAILTHRLLNGAADAYNELNEFVARGIIVETGSEPSYAFKVGLFERWLQRRSNRDRLLAFSEGAAYELHRIPDNLLPSSEVEQAIANWPLYKGKSVSVEEALAWLRQFGGVDEQRTMLPVLRSVLFYSQAFVRDHARSARSEINRSFLANNLVPKVNKKGKRTDLIIVHSNDDSSKECAKMFAQEASAFLADVVSLGNLPRHLETKDDLVGLVFVTALASGERSTLELEGLLTSNAQALEQGVKLFLVASVATGTWKIEAESIIAKYKIFAEFYVGEWLGSDRFCFSSESHNFVDTETCARAKSLSQTFGRFIDPGQPLGGAADGLAVVFEFGYAAPSLPILWGVSRDPKWTPLFI